MNHPTFDIVFSAHAAGLKASVSGEGTLENTLAYWRAIEAELVRRPSPTLLLVDEMSGEPLSAEQWRMLVEAMKGSALDAIRIAHVKPQGLQKIEYCEIFAMEAGMRTRVFSNEDEAVLWLRHGLS